MRLSKVIDEFTKVRTFRGSRLTTKRYDKLLRIFCLCMQDPELEELDLPHVLWYFGELERLGWKPNGINLIAIALRKLFEFCNLRGYETFNEQLIPVPRKEFNIPRVADLGTFKKVLNQIPDDSPRPNHIRNRALLLLLWDTGARVGELCSLNVDDLDFKKRTAYALERGEDTSRQSSLDTPFDGPRYGANPSEQFGCLERARPLEP
jgi:integrase/recombinase XerC